MDLNDFTPQQLAEASAADLDSLLSQLDISGNKKKFFAAFDTSDIDDIMKSFETKMASLSASSKGKISSLKNEIGETSAAAKRLQGQTGIMPGNPMAMLKDVFSKVTSTGEALTASREGLMLDKKMDKKSAYQRYMDQFAQMYGTVKDA
jgi:ribosomal protein L12E/L44/L45/RPP1/RPP2